ncbi:MAG: NAD(P)-dependent glycerol-3-phosphate dehydrogenase [Xanthomonadales bacterium]|nr:NAD(P)-dependent glycerol-3-phosphate dehydrogenase [Xanthomonadales bacterium]
MNKPLTKPLTKALVFAVAGAGSWGTALAIQLARAGQQVRLWGRDSSHIEEIRASGRNQRFLPGVDLPENLVAVPSLETALEGIDHLLIAAPSHGFGSVLAQSIKYLDVSRGLAWASKGFEPGSARLLHEVARDMLPADTPLALVTGPSFAMEVARNMPTAVTVAGTDPQFTRRFAAALHHGAFRTYTSDDLVGAELGGAVKNVLAVATGIADGMGLGDNARAALVTRGLVEMMRLGAAMGAQKETLVGLAGMGDLVLTCTGDQSRNRRFGLALGRGDNAEKALSEIGQVVEGINTAEEVHRQAHQHKVEMPISEVVYSIIHKGLAPEKGLKMLLSREPKAESI